MSIWYLKMFGDLKLKNLITWIVKLFDTKNVELKLKFGSDNWLSFLIKLVALTLQKRIELKKVNSVQKLNHQNILYFALYKAAILLKSTMVCLPLLWILNLITNLPNWLRFPPLENNILIDTSTNK